MKKVVSVCLAVIIAALPVLFLCACADSANTIYVLNWGDYIDPDLIKRFESETGYKIIYNTLTSNEEMLIKLSSSDCIYDLCFPSDYVIEKLIAQELLAELNYENIPNMSNIDKRFLDLEFDPDNTYSVPYMWGTVGILYNTTMVDEPVDSWDILWDEKYSGQILMYDSMRDSIGVALLKLGYDLNTRSEAEVGEAVAALNEQKPIRKGLFGDDIKEIMIDGSGALAVVYSGDAVFCCDEDEGNPDLAYAVPKEGSNVWFDNMVIPESSDNKAAVEAFINFLCQADVAMQNSQYIGYSSPNEAALKLMDDDWLNDETYNPPADVLDRCVIFKDLGDFVSVYESAWQQVKFSN